MLTSKIDRRQFLKRLPLFADFTPDELTALAAATEEQYLARGEPIFHRGDPSRGFHVVIYGQVKLGFLSAQGDEKIVEIIGPGFSFGEALMFMEKPYIVGYLLKDEPAGDGARVTLTVSKKLLASRLNLTPEYFSRVLHDLSELGMIAVQGRQVTLLDIGRLRAYQG